MSKQSSCEICFRPVERADFATLGTWLRAPHNVQWWGDPASELSLIVDMVEGRDTTKPYVFAMDGRPLGYIQVWFIGDHQTPEWLAKAPWLGLLAPQTVGVDLMIGDAENIGRGFGVRVLRAFTERLWDEGHREIIIDPDPANLRALRAYDRAGFRPVPALIGQTDDCLIMKYDPETHVRKDTPKRAA